MLPEGMPAGNGWGGFFCMVYFGSSAKQRFLLQRWFWALARVLSTSPPAALPHPSCPTCHELLEHGRAAGFGARLSSHWVLESHQQCCALGAWHCCRLAWSFWTHIYFVSFPLDVWVCLNGLEVFLEVKISQLLEYVWSNWLLKRSGSPLWAQMCFSAFSSPEQVTALVMTGRYFNLVHSAWVIYL